MKSASEDDVSPPPPVRPRRDRRRRRPILLLLAAAAATTMTVDAFFFVLDASTGTRRRRRVGGTRATSAANDDDDKSMFERTFKLRPPWESSRPPRESSASTRGSEDVDVDVDVDGRSTARSSSMKKSSSRAEEDDDGGAVEIAPVDEGDDDEGASSSSSSSSHHDAAVDAATGEGEEGKEGDDDGSVDDEDSHGLIAMSPSARVYANRAALLEGVLATKVRQLRTMTNRANLMEDALRRRRTMRHGGIMPTKENVDDRGGTGIEGSLSSFSSIPSPNDDVNREEGGEGQTAINDDQKEEEEEKDEKDKKEGIEKALQEEILTLQIEVRKLRTQLADLLDAHDELERRRHDDVEKVVAVYEGMMRESLGRYEARLAEERMEKEEYRDRWMESSRRRRHPGRGGKAGEDDNDDGEVDGENNTPPFTMDSIDDSPDSSDAGEAVARAEEGGRDDGALSEEGAKKDEDNSSRQPPQTRSTTMDGSTADKSSGMSLDPESRGELAVALNAAIEMAPSFTMNFLDNSLDSSTAEVVARTEEGRRVSNDDSDDCDDDISRGESEEIARAIDRIRELETQLRRREELHESSTARMLDQQHQLREYLRAQLATYYDTIQGQNARINDQIERMAENESRHEEAMLIAKSSVEASQRRERVLLTNIEELEGELAMARREIIEKERALIDVRSYLVELEGNIRDGDARERTLVECNEKLTTKIEELEWREQEATREVEWIQPEEDKTGFQVVEEVGRTIPLGKTNGRDKRGHVAPSHDTSANDSGDVVRKPRRRRWVRAILRPWALLWGR